MNNAFILLIILIKCLHLYQMRQITINNTNTDNQNKNLLNLLKSEINNESKLNNCKNIINKLNKNNKKRCNNRSNGYLWRITKKCANGTKSSVVSYAFGTIHVPYTLVWDQISNRVKHVFHRSDSVYFELDLLDPSTLTRLTNCQVLPFNKRLRDVLPNDLFRRLKSHLNYVRSVMPNWMSSDQRDNWGTGDRLFNAATNNWERKRPVWVIVIINSLTESDIRSRGIPVLDLYLAQEAQRLNKKVGAIENVEDQCNPLNGLNNSQVIFALNHTLSQHEAIRNGKLRPKMTTDDLIHHYICGDLDDIIFNEDTAFTRVTRLKNSTMYNNDDSDEERLVDDYIRSVLIVDRNTHMSKKVLNLLNSQPDHSFFFAFGAGHFLGEHSILNFLQQNGYEVERVNATDFRNTKLKKRLRYRCESLQNLPNVRVSYQNNTENTLKNVSSLNSNKFDVNNNLIIRTKHNIVEHSTDRANNSLYTTPLLPLSTTSSLLTAKSTTSIVSTTSSTILAEHYSSSKQKHRKFNDLWVRMETFPTNRPPLSIPRQPLLNKVEVGKNNKNLRVWYTNAISSHSNSISISSVILHINTHSIFILILFYTLNFYLKFIL